MMAKRVNFQLTLIFKVNRTTFPTYAENCQDTFTNAVFTMENCNNTFKYIKTNMFDIKIVLLRDKMSHTGNYLMLLGNRLLF